MRPLMLALSLAACAPNPAEVALGEAPPPASTLRLAVSSVVPGQTVAIKVRGLNPGERVYLLRGVVLGAGVCPAVAAGLCLDMTGAPSVVTSANADALGSVDWTVPVPAVPLGLRVAFQAVALRGPNSTKSNAVERITLAAPAATVTQPGDLLITELMADPDAVADADGEWFEVLNAGTVPVDLLGLGIGDSAGATEAVGLPTVLMPGQYALLARRGDPTVNGGLWPDYAFGSTVGLSNGGDTLGLWSGATLVDAVSWGAAPAGATLALDPAFTDDALNDDTTLWCDGADVFGAGDLGTPGAANPSCGSCGDGATGPGEACDDGNLANGDGCDAACVIEPPADADGDGYPATSDCDDAEPAVHPGAAEVCDGLDNDCNAATSESGKIWVDGAPGPATVAAAVALVPFGGVVELCDGVFPATNVAVPTGVTLRGAGQGATFIDGQSAGRVFSINADNVTIEAMTIQNGRLTPNGSVGAGIAVTCPGFPCDPSQNIVLRDVTLRNHATPSGTGSALHIAGPISTAGDSTVRMEDCTVEQNSGAQAAVYANGAVLTVLDTVFRANQSTQDGAALKVYEGLVQGTRLSFYSNVGSGYGGAVSVFYGGTFTCSACDLGAGATENTPDDVATYDGAIRHYSAYGAGVSPTCSVASQPNQAGTGRCLP